MALWLRTCCSAFALGTIPARLPNHSTHALTRFSQAVSPSHCELICVSRSRTVVCAADGGNGPKERSLDRTQLVRDVAQEKSSGSSEKTSIRETPEGFTIVSESLLYKRYQSVSERLVTYPDGRQVSFDVLGLGACKSVFVFPVRPQDGGLTTTTMLREYSPGQHRVMYGFPAGMWEPERHCRLEDAARAELSEEAALRGGQLVSLTSPTGVSADKYSRNVFHYFLAMDCVDDETPGARDAEEWIQVEKDVPLSTVRDLMSRGEMNAPNMVLAGLALEYLDKIGFTAR